MRNSHSREGGAPAVRRSVHVSGNESGMATFIALMLIGMLTLIGIAALSTSDDEVKISGSELRETNAFYAAESGLERACAAVQTTYEATNKPPVTMPSGVDTVNHYVVTYTTTDNGAPIQDNLSSGPYAGLLASVKEFDIVSTAAKAAEQTQVRVRATFETDLVPILQFGVFYNSDLEFSPGPQMTFVGRVHTNGNMYLQSNNQLKMDSYVTAAQHIYHGQKYGSSTASGDVQVKNAAGTYKSMKQGSGWLDADKSYWRDSSLARWQGRVKDQAHGQETIDLPLQSSTDTHDLIERATGNANSYENKATLKIVNNQAYQLVSGTWTDITGTLTGLGIMSYTADQFTDAREGKPVDVTNIDVAALYANGYGPSNGVMYFSDDISGSSEFPALRLNNASTLGANLTLASENPVYTKGNFNSTSQKAAVILSDALTMLSGNWDDAKSTLAKNQRSATATTVNCSYITGNVPSTSSHYSGGFENLPRLLESWTSKNLTWKGAAACLWSSHQATGYYSTAYFDDPNRNWTFDPNLDNLANYPADTPMARAFRRLGWSQDHVAYGSE
jgi:hypothetical protein